jgi:quercetin dioxygenase-like cupin family protein
MNDRHDAGCKGDLALGSAELIDMVGSRFELVVRMGVEEGDTVLFRTRMGPGKFVPLHSHSDPECFYVIGGRLEVFLVDDAPKWRPVEAGLSMLVADGVKHAVRNAGREPADLIVATNNRFAGFLRQAGRTVQPGAPFVAPTPEDFQRVIRVSEAYGYWNASPAESAAVTGTAAPGPPAA